MDTRFRLFIISIVGLLAVAVWTLPQWWALANPESVTTEVFPGLELSAQADFVALPANIKNAYNALYEGDEDLEIAGQPEWALALVRARLLQEDRTAVEFEQPFEQPVGSIVVRNGTFNDVDIIRQAEGDLVIYQLTDGTRLMRIDSNFISTRAPDIHIIFTRNADPMDEQGVGVDYIDIGELRGNVGAQNYAIPQSVDFSRFPILALYSPTYNAVLGTATLR